MSGPKYLSDPQYDTEFWFDAAGYTVLDWKGNFSSDAEARKAFDAWLNSIRAEAWNDGHDSGVDRVLSGNLYDPESYPNPYREEAE